MAKSVDEPSKANQDEWSYTVYDIDGGSKVTNQVIRAYLLELDGVPYTLIVFNIFSKFNSSDRFH